MEPITIARGRYLLGVMICAGVFASACGGAGNNSVSKPAPTQSPLTVVAPAAVNTPLPAAGSRAAAAPVTQAQGADACSLVTKADAEATVGEPVGAPTVRKTPTDSLCTYKSAGGTAYLNVHIWHWPDVATAANTFHQYQSTGQPLAGLGDQAVATSGYILVQKGAVLLEIALLGQSKQADPAGSIKTLAAKLLAQL